MTQQTALPELEPAPASEPADGPAVADRFASAPLRLDRLSTVRAGTVVLELADGPPVLRRPGDLLLPAWTPWGPGVTVLVVATGPVTVRVSVGRLQTLDGHTLALAELDVVARVVHEELPSLVAEQQLDLDANLRLEVQRAVEAGVRAAAGRALAEELRLQGLAAMLTAEWLPLTLAGGALVVQSYSIAGVRWASVDDPVGLDDDEDTAPLQRVLPGDPPPTRTLPAPVRAPRQDPDTGRRPVPQQDPAIEQSLPTEHAPGSGYEALRLAPLGRADRHQASRSADHALALVYLPLAISVTVWWVFFTAYWLPELQTVPGARFMLEQLAPLASKELTSAGDALVTGQGGHSGAPGAILLAVSLVMPPLARARYWVARLMIWPLTYIACVAAVVAVLGVLLRDRLLEDFLGVTLLVVWGYAAVVTTWHSLWVDIDTLPHRPAGVAWLLGLFALVATAPVALGRSIFAPELRQAALGVIGNEAALRWSALLTPATAWVYLSGLLLGVLVWAVYLLWPPRRGRRVSLPVTALVGATLLLALVGPEASRAAAAQSEAMRTQSPGERLSFTCGVWTRQPAGQPVQTLVISGLGCQQLATFRGYLETSQRPAGIWLSPVRALTFAGDRVEGRLVSARYGDIVVLAASDRVDRRPTALIGVGVADGTELWRLGCRADRAVRIRFAGATDGDDPAAARQTRRSERPLVELDCAGEVRRIDPRTGRRL